MKRALVALCALSIAISAPPVNAGQVGSSIRSTTTNTASWAIAAVGENQSVTNAPYILNWSVSGGTAYNYFALQNTGTTSVVGFLVIINQTRVGGNAPPNDIFFERCVGGLWDSLTNTCSGTVNLVGRASDITFTFSNVNLSPGAGLSMRARTTINGRNNFSTQVNTYVSRADIRNAQITHS